MIQRKLVLVEVKVSLVRDMAGTRLQLPGLLGYGGVVSVLVEYFEENSFRSISWMVIVRRAFKLFLQYVSVHPFQADGQKVFRGFATALITGTIDVATGLDESGLYWRSMRDRTAQTLVGALTALFDWMVDRGQMENHPNLLVKGTAADRAIAEACYQYRRNAALLGHSWAINSTSSSQHKSSPRQTSVRVARSGSLRPPSFPCERLEELIFVGFRTSRGYNYRDMLITLLMHGAGFRVSEPFHLFLGDVAVNLDGGARIFIHHPEQGGVPADTSSRDAAVNNRGAYLSSRWALKPRNRMLGSLHAGWKGGLQVDVDGAKVFPAYWFPDVCGHLFADIWPRYMRQVASMDRNHPFAFVNLFDSGTPGEILKIGMFTKSHSQAVERIGMRVSKADGTTPHGHRHAYGQALKNAGVNEKVIQKCLHHANVHSQDVYTQPSLKDVFDELKAAQTRLPSRYSELPRAFIGLQK